MVRRVGLRPGKSWPSRRAVSTDCRRSPAVRVEREGGRALSRYGLSQATRLGGPASPAQAQARGARPHGGGPPARYGLYATHAWHVLRQKRSGAYHSTWRARYAIRDTARQPDGPTARQPDSAEAIR